MTPREPTGEPNTAPPPGWYPDAQQPDLVRWWDGRVWTEHTAAAGPALTVVASYGSASYGSSPTTSPMTAPMSSPGTRLPVEDSDRAPARSVDRRRADLVWIWAAAGATAAVAIAAVVLIFVLAAA